jgi:polyisoprenoid-binding protein YceI
MDARERWKIDADRSSLAFHLPHTLLGEISGRFDCWGGRLLLDPVNLEQSAVRIWVELSSIDTGSRRRDEELLRTELFDRLWEPALEFDSDRLEFRPSGAALGGWVTLRAVRARASIEIDSPELNVDASGKPRFVCAARTSLDRKALGMRHAGTAEDWLSDRLLGGKIDIVAHIEASREGSPLVPWALDALQSRVTLAGASAA